MNLPDCNKLIQKSFDSIHLFSPEGTPYFYLSREIIEMIQSYLSDADFFSCKNDFVNQYASLIYALGWMDAGHYLGLYDVKTQTIVFDKITLPELYDVHHLEEKTRRYFAMLSSALHSVAPFPSKGSPLSDAAEKGLVVAGEALIKSENCIAHSSFIPALGYLCYGYGWLDTMVRAGLLQIHSNPSLFTTEC